jgi:nitrate/nitrite transporter NarK
LLSLAVVWCDGCGQKKGDFCELRRHGLIRSKPLSSLSQATRRLTTWVLALQYALTFGTEVTLFNVAASYFTDKFHVRQGHSVDLSACCTGEMEEATASSPDHLIAHW